MNAPKRPKHPEMFKSRVDRILDLQKNPALRIPPIFVLECKLVLKAYYGSYFKAALNLLFEWVYLESHSYYWACVYKFCDWVGWTYLRPIYPDNPKMKQRHGHQCTYMNCRDMKCIDNGIPRWFKWLTRIKKHEDR